MLPLQIDYALTLSFLMTTIRRMSRRILLSLCGVLLLVLGTAARGRAQQRPLLTEDVDIIPTGSLRIETGVDFFQGAKYPVSGLTGDLTASV